MQARVLIVAGALLVIWGLSGGNVWTFGLGLYLTELGVLEEIRRTRK